MARDTTTAPQSGRFSAANLVAACIAGFVAVLIFHQLMLALLHATGLTPGTPYSLRATAPLGVPQFLSLAFWGGVWGLVYAALEPGFPSDAFYWLAALLFGALAPTLVAWFVVSPLKGLPVAAGWHAAGMATGLLVNGAWGIGTAFFLALARRRWP